MNGDYLHLSDLIDSLQERGRYFLSKDFIRKELGFTENALDSSIKRMQRKNRLISLRKSFYLIVPLEYKNIGAPPPDWFIDQLMQEYSAKYYVSLLTAAALHGAAHQQPQIYQVTTNRSLRPVKIGRARIVFYLKKDFEDFGITKMKTPTGYMNVSIPELTTFDLVRYLKPSGHIHHVSTVLTELGEAIDPKTLSEVAAFFPQACIQRTGYILDAVGFSHKTTQLLKYVQELPSRYYPLRSDKNWSLDEKNKDWHLYINEQLEPDL